MNKLYRCYGAIILFLSAVKYDSQKYENAYRKSAEERYIYILHYL